MQWGLQHWINSTPAKITQVYKYGNYTFALLMDWTMNVTQPKQMLNYANNHAGIVGIACALWSRLGVLKENLGCLAVGLN